MLDLLFLAEISWCIVVLRTMQPQRTVVCAAGMAAAGYAGVSMSSWLQRVLAPPGSPTMDWIIQKVANMEDRKVAVLASFVPAEPTTAGSGTGSELTWIAQHVAHALFAGAISLAVFLLFLVTTMLRNALWDTKISVPGHADGLLRGMVSICCGVYVATMSGWMLGNAAWICPNTFIPEAVTHSFGMQLIRMAASRVL
ncbi:MAG: hypothetical protein K6T83_00710 [Alicyclobacillus sp.]|nr:hypothetical protein [Alicyclobacillus sp.]